MSFGESAGDDRGSDDGKIPKRADRQFAEHHPQGARLRWPSPPSVRIGAHGIAIAPSSSGTVTMRIAGGSLVRFDLEGGRATEPMEPCHGQPCEASP